MFLVEWGESSQGKYGIFLAKSMRDYDRDWETYILS